MKHGILFSILVALLFISVGCSYDGGGSCVQADFIGTYTGSETCNIGSSLSNQYVITAGTRSSQIIVSDDLGTIYTFSINGCGFSQDDIILGSGEQLNGSLDGTSLKFTRKTTVLGATILECTFTGTK